uniref:DUF4220 domain-containing protein n=1 Tax=Ananas comosus var. bracteatus TaxID=296719 RepID=A0A6V7NKK8_ANACO|nr:unnamed protein product [Ananas comosus var. bracteatus]
MLADDDAFIGAALVDMYGKCSCMGLAMKAFCFLRAKSVVAWSSLVANYVQNNDYFAALQAFREMTLANSEVPNAVTLTTLITACARIPSLLHGKELHSAVIRRRPSEPDVFVSTALVSMYCKCGRWPEHVANDRVNDALSMIRLMGGALRNRVALNSVTMATVSSNVVNLCRSFTEGTPLLCREVWFRSSGPKQNPTSYEPKLRNDAAVTTVEAVWRCEGRLFKGSSRGRYRDMCLSFALFKLIKMRFDGYPQVEDESKSRALVRDGLLSEDNDGKRAFKVIKSELGFLRDLFHTSTL